MDVVGSILNSMEKLPSVKTTEVKATQLHWQKKTKEEPDLKKKFDQISEKVFVCGVCGKKYTDNKKLRSHKNGHKRHKREIKDLDSDGKKNECLSKGNNESLPIKLGEYVDTFSSLDDDSNLSSTPQMKISSDQPSSNSDFQYKKKNPSEEKSVHKCNICTRIFNKRSSYIYHKTRHEKEKKALDSKDKKNECFTKVINDSLPIKLGVYVDTFMSPIDDNNLSSTLQMEVSGDQPSPNSDSHLEKKNPPEKKSSFKCNVCDRIFTKRRTYLNHKTNHNYNKNTSKALFFKRKNIKKIQQISRNK